MKCADGTAQILAARLATLFVLQLGYDDEFCSKLSNFLSNSLRRSTTSPSVAAAICTTLAFLELVDNESMHNGSLMDLLRDIFSDTKSNGDTLNEPTSILRIKALEACGLLLTLCSPKDVCSHVGGRVLKDLIEILHIPNIDFRIACGHVILLVIEQGRIYDSTFLQSDLPELCNVIRNVVSDGHKNICKDKRRTQNTKFREILKYMDVCRENENIKVKLISYLSFRMGVNFHFN